MFKKYLNNYYPVQNKLSYSFWFPSKGFEVKLKASEKIQCVRGLFTLAEDQSSVVNAQTRQVTAATHKCLKVQLQGM